MDNQDLLASLILFMSREGITKCEYTPEDAINEASRVSRAIKDFHMEEDLRRFKEFEESLSKLD